MSPDEIERIAKGLYERRAIVAPTWDQLGEITKGVWREEAEKALALYRKIKQERQEKE